MAITGGRVSPEEQLRRDAEAAAQRQREEADRRAREDAQAASAASTGAQTGQTQAQTGYNFATTQPTAAVGFGAQITQPAFETQQQALVEGQVAQQRAEKEAALNQQIWNARMASLQRSAGSAPAVGGGAPVANEEAARAVAFGRAKDQAGQIAAASLQSLQNILNARGTTGSTEEARGVADIVGGAGSGLQEVTREQLLQDLQRAAEVADRNYAGGITQRGQDLASQQSLYSLAGAGRLY